MRILCAAVTCLVSLALAGGCATVIGPEELQAWVGRPASALEREWGPPTREVEDEGLRVLIYEQVERSTATDFRNQDASRPPRGERGVYGTAQAMANEAARGPSVYARSFLFWVNREGAIVRADLHQP